MNNELSTQDYASLEKLEEALWKPETRFDVGFMKTVLAEDFFEFGRSGKVYRREDTLSAAGNEIKAKFPLENFEAKLLDRNTALITYTSEVAYEEVERANRSSIWSRTNNGWKLRFHQGTPIG